MIAQYNRSRETARTAAGVRLPPSHTLSMSVHAFHRWTGEHELVTWCGIAVSVEDGARITTDTITCLGCPQASLQAFRRPG